jgi:hypothetical protein
MSVLLFQSAPLTEVRGDPLRRRAGRSSGRVSIRAPDRSQGRQGAVGAALAARGVSIRAPDRSQGRPGNGSCRKAPSLFQSAPLTEVRGDSNSVNWTRYWVMFQSAPLTEVRGDCGPPNGLVRRCFVASQREPAQSVGAPFDLLHVKERAIAPFAQETRHFRETSRARPVL